MKKTCIYNHVATKIITVDPPSVPGTLTGGGTFCGLNASGTLTLSGYTGNIVNWEYSINNGVTWLPITNTTNTEVYTSLTQTTLYRSYLRFYGYFGGLNFHTSLRNCFFSFPPCISRNRNMALFQKN